MTRSELIKLISVQYPNHSFENIIKIVDSIFNDLSKALVERQKIEIRKFGSFSIRKRKVNNEKENNSKEHNIIYFRAGKEFKKIVNK